MVSREREQQAILLARSGDRDEFSLLIDAYADRIFGYLVLMVKNRADAEELSQEVFLKAYRGLKGFKPGFPFAPWLFRIARNEALNWARRAKRQGMLSGRDDPELPAPEPVDLSPGPMELMLEKERKRDARRMIASLEEKYRSVLVLRYGEGLSYREIAGVLSLPEGTVKTLLHRAKAKLERMARGETSALPVAASEVR